MAETLLIFFHLFDILPSGLIPATYSSELTENHALYKRYPGAQPLYFYEAIQVIISAPDLVGFVSNSTADIYAYFYNGRFDPWYPLLNLLAEDDDGAGYNNQFSLNYSLNVNQIYVLVITTFNINETGPFTVTAYSSSGYVHFARIIIPTTTYNNNNDDNNNRHYHN